MPFIDSGLRAIFGAAFSGLYLAATLHKVTATDNGTGGFLAPTVDYPVLAMLDRLDERARAASGLPAPAITISLLQAGLTVAVDLDDSITIGAATYRVIGRDQDPAAAAWSLAAVPV